MKETTLITGYYGSGKSEFAINLALALNSEGKDVILADLDIINPYFRSVEAKHHLTSLGIEVVSTSFEGQMDLPAVPGKVFSLFTEEGKHKIIDLGGDEEGARMLGYLKEEVMENDFDFWYCLNYNRSETSTIEKALAILKRIEESSKQKISGIVNTTHLMQYTTKEDVLAGAEFARQVSQFSEIPLIYNVVEESLASSVSELDKLFVIKIHLKKPWEE